MRSQEEKEEENQAKAFAADINYFLSKEQFNFYDFHERVVVSLHKITSNRCCFCNKECSQAEVNDQDDDLGR